MGSKAWLAVAQRIVNCELDTRAIWQCNACRTQTSLTAGTIIASTELDLTV
jgi:hypothetical protein